MSKILINNIINLDSVESITHTASPGTVTGLTSLESLADRSILNSYKWTSSEFGSTSTITITLSDDFQFLSSFSLLSIYLNYNEDGGFSVQLRDIVGDVIRTLTLPDAKRLKKQNENSLYDLTWTFSNTPVKTIVINCDNNDSGESGIFQIGTVYGGAFKDIKIKPTSLIYGFKTQGTKSRAVGGQIYASKNISYMTASFTTIATAQTDVVNNYFDINYESSVSEPIIFVPEDGGDIILYGTQEKPNSTRCLLAKNQVDWYYETSFSIEEEL